MKVFFVLYFFIVIALVAATDESGDKHQLGYKHHKKDEIPSEDGYIIDLPYVQGSGPSSILCPNRGLGLSGSGCSIYTRGYDMTSLTYQMGVRTNISDVCKCILACMTTKGCLSYTYKYAINSTDTNRDCFLSMGITRVNTVTGLYRSNIKCTKHDGTWDQECYSGLAIKWPDNRMQC